jgi:hypothetical protein
MSCSRSSEEDETGEAKHPSEEPRLYPPTHELVLLFHRKIVILSGAPFGFYRVAQRLTGAQSKDPEGANTRYTLTPFRARKLEHGC